ncbi:MAG: hypothetical protein NT038_07165, partial [Euryarchaeota archaeon]|nr:hypothetical protein [Euryarchaeota archaeon]
DQPDGESVMSADPSISITNETLTVTVTYNLPVFIGVPEKDSTSGMGKCMIRTSYSGSDTQTYLSGIHSIQFYTNYVNAWNDSLSTILGGAGTVIKGTNYVQLNPYPGKTFGLVVKKLYISAQIGPGWVI